MPLLAQDLRFRFGLESDMNYRDSDEAKFGIPFPFPEEFLPPGETSGSLETVQAGSYYEMSRFTLVGHMEYGQWSGHAKVDVIDLYDRNPTSSDRQWDMDEIWIRYGTESEPGDVPEARSFFVKLGKFGKFERQDDRHLVSYGLASTVFNRLEDAGMEGGFQITKNIYVKGSYTVGNPLFLRDANALAGDNGSPARNPFINPFPDPPYKSGFVFFYDAEIEDLRFSEAELGLAGGFWYGDDYGRRSVNVLVSYFERDLRDTVDMRGSFYGGDMDLLLGVEELGLPPGLPLEGKSKEELTITSWVYFDSGTLFLQSIDSEVAGLGRTALEGELSWTFKLPLWLAFQKSQILPSVTPAIRYSKLEPDFVGNAGVYPTPSVWWEWKKLDYGVSARLYRGWRLFIEYSDNQFLRLGKWEHADEFLTTLRWRWNSEQEK